MPPQINENFNTPAPPTQAPAAHGNWFDSLVPTIGAVGGGILGGLGGAFAAPFTGGIVNPIDAGIAGAGLGGAAGQQFENSQTGSKGSTLMTGLESAGGQALGEGALAGAGKLLGGVAGSGAVQGASDLATRTLLKDQLNMHNLPNGIDPDSVVSTLMDNGITDLKKAPQLISLLTGSADASGANAGLYNNTVDSIINQMKDNGTRIFGKYSSDTAEQATSGSLGSNFLNDSSKNAAIKYINDQLQQAGLLKEAPGGGRKIAPLPIPNSDGADPTAVAQSYKNLRDAIRQQPFEGNGKATAQAYGKVADQLENDLYNHQEATLTPEMKDDMRAALAPLEKSNPTAYNTQMATIDKANTAADLQSAQQKLVEMSQAIESPASKATHIGAKDLIAPGIGMATGGIPGGMLGAGADIALRSPAVLAKLTGLASGAPDMLAGAGGALANKAGVVTGGALGAGAAGDINGAKNNSNNQSANAGGGNTVNSQSGGTGMGDTPLSTLTELNNMLEADPLLAASLAPQVAQLTQQVSKATAAKQALDQYQQTLQSAGGPAGPIGGLLEQVGGTITGQQSQVDAQRKALQALLAAAGAGNGAVPGLMASPGGAASSIGQTQGVLGALGGQ